MSRRTDRVSSLLRDELSTLVQHELKDPRLGKLVTITSVKTTSDLLHARVYVSVLGTVQDREDVIKALTAAQGFVRRQLRARVQLRPIPELHFVSDTSIEEGARVQALLDQVASEAGAERP